MVQHDFGAYLSEERNNSGYTLRKLAALVNLSPSTISRWENNHVVPLRSEVDKVDKALELQGRLVSVWEFAKAEGLPQWMHSVSRLEEAAEAIDLISPLLVPGLLQSPSYARLVFEESLMGREPGDLERLVELRCGRYEQLRKLNNPRTIAVFPVTAVTCVPDRVRKEQASHLLSIAEMGRMRFHLVPEDSILLGVTSMLLLFHLRDGGKAAVSDHVDGATLYEDTKVYDRLHGLVKQALGSALPATQSRKLLEELR
ncbi:helix-turn-helix transcriptional regulator [Nocardiopsis akebiae]|uniref:Helix-turn-helix transcriptional regulator n=1 Tax=Nocardiopsis akebiae TaxID=2831968 RepID=A0ABX8CBU9_9ACTN|nr:helix-turn-helix transcriptional regulator [Nocardiopsis akebiae]QUX31497.1 helix-turn-helix transcriptional regulator [Nocardiopsis akebiae]